MWSSKTAFQLQNTKTGEPIGPVCVSPALETWAFWYMLCRSKLKKFISICLNVFLMCTSLFTYIKWTSKCKYKKNYILFRLFMLLIISMCVTVPYTCALLIKIASFQNLKYSRVFIRNIHTDAGLCYVLQPMTNTEMRPDVPRQHNCQRCIECHS